MSRGRREREGEHLRYLFLPRQIIVRPLQSSFVVKEANNNQPRQLFATVLRQGRRRKRVEGGCKVAVFDPQFTRHYVRYLRRITEWRVITLQGDEEGKGTERGRERERERGWSRSILFDSHVATTRGKKNSRQAWNSDVIVLRIHG